MKCAYVYSDGDETLVSCNRDGFLDEGRPTCEEHAIPRGWVYLMAWGDFVKIGFAKDPIIRLAQISRGMPNVLMPPDQPGTIYLVGAVRGNMDAEKLIHAALDSDRVVGEWFRRSPAVERMVAYMEQNGAYRSLGTLSDEFILSPSQPVVPVDF